MAANDIPTLSTSNTFGHLLVATNALIKQANLLNSGTYVKEGGDLRVLDGSVSLDKTSGVTLTVASDATFGGTLSSKTIINSGDLTVQGQNALFSNATGTVSVTNNVTASNVTARTRLISRDLSANGYVAASGVNLENAPTITAFGEKAAVNVANKMFVSNSGNVDVQGTMLVSKTSGLALNVRSNAIFAGEVAVRSATPIVNVSSSGQVAILQLQSTTGTTDNNVWHLRTVDSSGKLRLQAQTDALAGGGSVLDINRNAQQITGIDLSVSSSNNALRITQTGSGNAFVVEDSSSPDSTPFVIGASGNVGIGTATELSTYKLKVEGSTYLNGDVILGATTIRDWSASDTDIDALIPGSTFGSLIEGTNSAHTVIGIPGNDSNDGFYVIDKLNDGDGSGTYKQVLLGVSNTAFEYKNANTSRFYIDSIGNVGVGITGPTSKLHVGGGANITSNLVVGGRSTLSNTLTVNVGNDLDAVRITQSGNGRAFVVEDSTNPDSTPFFITANGDVSIGGDDDFPFIKLYVSDTASSNTESEYAQWTTLTATPNTGTSSKYTNHSRIVVTDWGTALGTAASYFGYATGRGNMAAGALRSFYALGDALIPGGGNVFNLDLYYGTTTTPSAGNTITNLYGFRVADLAAGNNNYGFTSLVSAGANKWGFYSAGTANNYFNGSVGLGITGPTSKLHVVGDANVTTNLVVGGRSTLSNTLTVSVNNDLDAVRITQTGTGNAFVVEDSTNPDSTPFVIDADGRVGIGAVPATTVGSIQTLKTLSSSSVNEYGHYFQTNSAAPSGTIAKVGVQGYLSIRPTFNQTSGPQVTYGGWAISATSNVVPEVRVFGSFVESSGSGTITNAFQYHAGDGFLGTGGANTITNLYGYHVTDLTAGTNDYGFSSDVSAGANKWNFYASGTANNYFNGSVGVGIAGPTSKLHVVGDGNITTNLTVGNGLLVSGMNVTQTIVSAYNAANLAVNRTQVSANSGSVQSNVSVNFVNTSTVQVSVVPGAAGVANVSFTSAADGVTSVATGTGLSGGTITSTGTITANIASTTVVGVTKLIDSVTSTDAANAATGAAVKAAFDQATNAYNTANTGINTVAVSSGGLNQQTNKQLNFNSTANVIVSVASGVGSNANVSFDLPSVLPKLTVTDLTATSLTVVNPIIAPSESDSASYRLRVSQTTRGDGYFGVNQGGANGNAYIRFSAATGNVWQITANSIQGTYYDIITSQNVSSSVTSTSTTNVASSSAAKSAFDQATAAFSQANTALNKAQVTANGASTQSNASLNFINTSSVQVTVTSGGAGIANIAFTSGLDGVTSVATGTGLSGGTITTTGTISANIASTTAVGVTKLIDSVTSTDAANAATASAVKNTFDQATAGYSAANTAANTVAVYANTSLILSKAPINFNNSSSVRVNAQPSGSSYTNVSFSVIGGSGSGLDADTLDGLNSASFVRSDANTIGNIGLSGAAPYIRLESNDIDVFSGQEIASILFSTTDASAGGAGDKGKLSAEAEGTSGGAALNFFTSIDGGSAKIGSSLRGNNDLRLYSSGGTNFHAIRSQAAANSTLIIPSGDITLKTGTLANTIDVGTAYSAANAAANTTRVSGNSSSIQNAVSLNFTNTTTIGVTVSPGAAGTANIAFTSLTLGGTVTQVNTGIGLAGGGFTTSGTISANIASTAVQGITKLIDSVTSTDTANAATGAAVKVAFDRGSDARNQANLAYTQANTGTTIAQAAYVKANSAANSAQVSANSGSIISSAAVNFVNTSTVQVSVVSGGAGTANVSFTSATDGVSSVATGIGLSGGTITSTGTITANIASTTVQGVTKLVDAVNSTDTANAATGAAVKTAFDQATASYGRANVAATQANTARDQANAAFTIANTGLNKAQVSANGSSVQSNVGINFNNTSTVQVSVGAGTAGNSNVSFSVIPSFTSQILTTADIYAVTGIFTGSGVSNTTISTSAITLRSNIANQTNAYVELVASGSGPSSGISYLELGANAANYIDFKTPFNDDYDYRIYGDKSSGLSIYAGSSTSSLNVLNILSGNVNIDSGTLFVDYLTDRVGIGKTTPAAKLDVEGDTNISGLFSANGGALFNDTAITLSRPSALQYTRITNNDASGTKIFAYSSNNNVKPIIFDCYSSNTTANGIVHTNGRLGYTFRINGSDVFEIANTALTNSVKTTFTNTNVGIGVNDPTAPLDVLGDVKVSEYTYTKRITAGGSYQPVTGVAGTTAVPGFMLASNTTIGEVLGEMDLSFYGGSADTSAKLKFARTGSGAGSVIGVPAIVNSGDTIGKIEFSASGGGTVVRQAATIDAYVDGSPSDSSMPGKLVFSTSPVGGILPNERMAISSNVRMIVPTIINVNDSRDALKVIQDPAATGNIFSAILNDESSGIVVDNEGILRICTTGTAVNFSDPVPKAIFSQTGYGTPQQPSVWVSSTQPGGASILLSTYESTIGINKAALTIHRSRGFANGTFGAILRNDVIGAIDFTGDSGTAINAAASIVAVCEGTGAGFVSGRLDFRTAENTRTPAVRMTIANTGFVGIANTDPTHNLSVTGTSFVSGAAFFTGTVVDRPVTSIAASASYAENAAGRTVVVNSASPVTLTFNSAAYAGFTIDIIRKGTGNVTIANTSSIAKLNVASVQPVSNISSQYATVRVTYTATNEFILTGSIQP